MASPAYDLATHGITGFARFGRVLGQRKISRDPLAGVLDGANRVFHTQFYPILTSGSLGVYVAGNSVTGVADYETGEVTLDDVPTTQPEATYTFTPYTPTQILQFLVSGFSEMEMRFARGWKLVTSSGSSADEGSGQILVADADGNDPVCGALVFSQSVLQVGFLLACARYNYFASQMGESAITDYEVRENLRGMAVNKRDRPRNLAAVVEIEEKRLQAYLAEVYEDYYTDVYGGSVLPPVTLDYAGNYEWQALSKSLDYRSTLGLQVSVRPFGAY